MRSVSSIVFLLCLAAFGVACTMDVSDAVFRIRGDYLGATGFPRAVGGLLALFSLIAAAVIAIRGDRDAPAIRLNRKSWAVIAISSGYILGISYVGFALSTLVYLFLTSAIFCDFKRSRLKGIALYAILVTAVAFTFFKTFKVYLPNTILF